MSIKLEINKKYPKKYFEGATLEYIQTTPNTLGHFELRIALPNITNHEIKEFDTGKHNFGLFQYEGVLFFLSSFEGLLDSSDAPFHFALYDNHKSLLSSFQKGFKEDEGFFLQVHVIDSKNGLLRALKLIQLGNRFSKILAEMCYIQTLMPINKAELLKTVSYAQRLYTADDMFEKAIVTNEGVSHSKSEVNGQEPLKIRESLEGIATWAIEKKTYHSNIPDELKEYHYWIADSGHVVMAVPTIFLDEVKNSTHFDYEVPIPLKYALEKGYKNHGDFIEIDAPYDNVYGLVVEEKYSEF